MNIKETEAVIEAILFTMGESVEASRIAKAIEQSMKDNNDNLVQSVEQLYTYASNKGIKSDIEEDEKIEYSIVGVTEVDVSKNMISNESPIAQGLIGKKKGQVVDVEVPAGTIKFKILSISRID